MMLPSVPGLRPSLAASGSMLTAVIAGAVVLGGVMGFASATRPVQAAATASPLTLQAALTAPGATELPPSASRLRDLAAAVRVAAAATEELASGQSSISVANDGSPTAIGRSPGPVAADPPAETDAPIRAPSAAEPVRKIADRLPAPVPNSVGAVIDTAPDTAGAVNAIPAPVSVSVKTPLVAEPVIETVRETADSVPTLPRP